MEGEEEEGRMRIGLAWRLRFMLLGLVVLIGRGGKWVEGEGIGEVF